jgi:hypothetical protein
MRGLVFWILAWAALANLAGQSAEDAAIRLKQSGEVGDIAPPEEQAASAVHGRGLSAGYWNLETGAWFSTVRGVGSGVGFYAAPTYTLPLNSNWSLHGGIMATRYTGLSTPVGGDLGANTGYTGLSVFAAASYRMTDKLVLHGAGVKQLTPGPPSLMSPYSSDNLSLGATYRLGDNLTIGASIHMQNHQGYPYGSPYGAFPQGGFPGSSPFGW